MTLTVNRLLLIVALVLFVLAALGIGSLGPVTLVPAGLAAWVAAQLA